MIQLRKYLQEINNFWKRIQDVESNRDQQNKINHSSKYYYFI